MIRFFTSLFLLVGTMSVMAQVPNCRDLNVSVNALGIANLAPGDLISNVASGIDTVEVELFNELDLSVFGPVVVPVDSNLSIPVCPYIGKGLKAFISNEEGACWSLLTFKKNQGAIIMGRPYDVYCYDELVDGPLDAPDVVNACEPYNERPEFVTDWVIGYECDNGVQDTAKVIYREWEVIGKEGLRGVGFDTIVVFKLPQITENNIWCTLGDTIYCTDIDSLVGPYITIPENPLDPEGGCIDIPLLEFRDTNQDGKLEIYERIFDDKCGLAVHVDKERLEVDCSVQYRISVDIKQSCYGMPQSTCIVPTPAGTPPNIAENLGDGYWRCVFWLMDLDTLPPVIHCKDPVLFNGVFDLDYWYENMAGDGYVDYDWDPYQLTLVGNDDGIDDRSTELCLTLPKDTTIAFAWEFESDNSHAFDDPFGYTLNGKFFQLTHGDMLEDSALVQTGYKILELKEGDIFCFSQRSTDGVEGRAFTTIKPIKVVNTSQNECQAHIYVPDVSVNDDWSGIKTVKARVDGIGTYILDYNPERDCYESHDRMALPHSADPYKIYYEAYDSCHNMSLDSCYVLVKDRTRPTVILDKGVTVSLSGKKVWVDAETFDEGSKDNCNELNMLLVRRADWYDACLDLCDSLKPVCVTEHHDTLWKAYLEPNKDIDEVEAHYAAQLWDWKEDPEPCTNIMYNAWMYSLIKHGTLHCDSTYYGKKEDVLKMIQGCADEVEGYFEPVDIHPDPYDDEIFEEEDFKFDRSLLDMYEQIGGGWSDAVPFDCEDACSSVKVEVLAMDYWCNWTIGWMDVWVEDKEPAEIVRDVEDIDITCKIYKTPLYEVEGQDLPLSIASIVDLAKEKDAAALGALDAIFGGYQKVWEGPYGHYLDVYGNEVETKIPFVDSSCYCRLDTVIGYREYDEHLGAYWRYDTLYECGYDPVLDTFNQGIVLANCASLVDCSQEVWCDIDHCGEGYIYRKFKIWQGCPPGFYYDESVPDSLKQAHIPDTIERIQRIYVYNECGLEEEFFDVPEDVDQLSCTLEYDSDGSGNVAGSAHPDSTGWLRYHFDDDCRLVGVAYDDKVFKIVGGEEGCYKIQRTWYYMDWCEGQPTAKKWYKDDELEIDSVVQFIILYDTTPPLCTIDGPVESGDTIEVSACSYNFHATIAVNDTCGVEKYEWTLQLQEGETHSQVTSGKGNFLTDEADIFVEDLLPGNYKLQVEISDHCNNEGLCEYLFTIVPAKKPSAICLSVLTARLNPMDRNSDGIADTSMATIWASELDQSSRYVCQDTAIEFRIEKLDGVDDDSPEGDPDSLVMGCSDLGSNMVRLWVISHPSRTFDYCDVIVIVQGDGTGCPEDEEPEPEPPATVIEVPPAIEKPVRTHHQTNTIANTVIPPRLPMGSSLAGDRFEVGQNFPNPFTGSTIVPIYLEEEERVALSVLDLTGRVIYSSTSKLTRGYHLWELTHEQVGGAGIRYYQVRSGDKVVTKKMIVVN